MKTLLALVSALLLCSFNPSKVAKTVDSFDFGRSKYGADWSILTDGVMGGLSSGSAALTDNSLVMSGEISLANNGGFASVKSPWRKTDVSAYEEVMIRYRSNGQSIAFTFETDRRWWMPYYLIDLPGTKGEWKEITVALTAAKEKALAKSTGKHLEESQLDEILRFGFMTNEKKESAYMFEVDYVKFQ